MSCYTKYQGYAVQMYFKPGNSAFDIDTFWTWPTVNNTQSLKYVTSAVYDDVNDKIGYPVTAYLVLVTLDDSLVRENYICMFRINSTSPYKVIKLDNNYMHRSNTIVLGASKYSNTSDLNSYKIWMQFQFRTAQSTDNLRIDTLDFVVDPPALDSYKSTTNQNRYTISKFFIRRAVQNSTDYLVVLGTVLISGTHRIFMMKINDGSKVIEELYYSSLVQYPFDFCASQCHGVDSQNNLECQRHWIYGYPVQNNNWVPPIYNNQRFAIAEFFSDFRKMACGNWFLIFNVGFVFGTSSVHIFMPVGVAKSFLVFHSVDSTIKAWFDVEMNQFAPIIDVNSQRRGIWDVKALFNQSITGSITCTTGAHAPKNSGYFFSYLASSQITSGTTLNGVSYATRFFAGIQYNHNLGYMVVCISWYATKYYVKCDHYVGGTGGFTYPYPYPQVPTGNYENIDQSLVNQTSLLSSQTSVTIGPRIPLDCFQQNDPFTNFSDISQNLYDLNSGNYTKLLTPNIFNITNITDLKGPKCPVVDQFEVKPAYLNWTGNMTNATVEIQTLNVGWQNFTFTFFSTYKGQNFRVQEFIYSVLVCPLVSIIDNKDQSLTIRKTINQQQLPINLTSLYKFEPASYVPQLVLNDSSGLIQGNQSGVYANATRGDLFSFWISMIHTKDFELCKIKLPVRKNFTLEIVDCSLIKMSVALKTPLMFTVDINQVILQTLSYTKMRNWFRPLEKIDLCSDFYVLLLNSTTNQEYQSTIPSLKWIPNQEFSIISQAQKKESEFKLKAVACYEGNQCADYSVFVEVKFVKYPEFVKPPFFIGSLPEIIIDDEVAAINKKAVFESPKARDDKNYKIQIFLSGLQQVPCQCLTFTDNKDGTYNVEALKSSLLKIANNGQYTLAVQLKNEMKAISGYYTQQLTIKINREVVVSDPIELEFDQHSSYVLTQDKYQNKVRDTNSVIKINKWALASTDKGQEVNQLFDGAVKMNSQNFGIQFDFKKLLQHPLLRFYIVAINERLDSRGWQPVILKKSMKIDSSSTKKEVVKMGEFFESQGKKVQALNISNTQFLAQITKIEMNGKAHIFFNQEMGQLQNLTWLNNSVLNVSLSLSTKTIEMGKRLDIPLDQLQNLSWSVFSFVTNNLVLQVEFQKPVYLAVEGAVDFLVVTVLNPELFAFLSAGKVLETYQMKKIMIKQIPQSGISGTLSRSKDKITTGMYVWMAIQIVANFLISNGIGELFSLLNSMQIICFQQLLNLEQPSNVQTTIGAIINLLNADLIQAQYTTALIYDFGPDNQFSETAKELQLDIGISDSMRDMDLDTFNPVLNLGGLYIVIVFELVSIGVVIVIRQYQNCCKSCEEVDDLEQQEEGGSINPMRRRKKKNKNFIDLGSYQLKKPKKTVQIQPDSVKANVSLKRKKKEETPKEEVQLTCYEKSKQAFFKKINTFNNKLFFSRIIVLSKETYIQMLLSGLLYFQMPQELKDYYLEQMPIQYKNNTALSGILLVITLFVFPIASLSVLFAPLRYLEDKVLIYRFGMFWENHYLESKYQRLHLMLWMGRRIWLCLIVIIFDFSQGLQIISVLYSNLSFFLYIGFARPHKPQSMNSYYLVHEFITLTLTSQYAIFTDYCPDPEKRYNLGWIFIFEFLLFILVRLMQIIGQKIWILLIHIEKFCYDWDAKRLSRRLAYLNMNVIKEAAKKMNRPEFDIQGHLNILLQIVDLQDRKLTSMQWEAFKFHRLSNMNKVRAKVLEEMIKRDIFTKAMRDIIKDTDLLSNKEKCKFTFEYEAVRILEKQWSLSTQIQDMNEKERKDSFTSFLKEHLQHTWIWHRDVHLSPNLKPQDLKNWRKVKLSVLDGWPVTDIIDDWLLDNFNPFWFKKVEYTDRQLVNYIKNDKLPYHLDDHIQRYWNLNGVYRLQEFKPKRRIIEVKKCITRDFLKAPTVQQFFTCQCKIQDLYLQLIRSAKRDLKQKRVYQDYCNIHKYWGLDQTGINLLFFIWDKVRELDSSTFKQYDPNIMEETQQVDEEEFKPEPEPTQTKDQGKNNKDQQISFD